MAETRINTECFLPTWEGVSRPIERLTWPCPFPPYMGGCIASISFSCKSKDVSSLHGRVYRERDEIVIRGVGFLPTWEGVSERATMPESQI